MGHVQCEPYRTGVVILYSGGRPTPLTERFNGLEEVGVVGSHPHAQNPVEDRPFRQHDRP